MATPLIARTLLVAVTLALGSAPALAAWSNDPAVNLAVCTEGDNQDTPVVASNGAGGALVAWCDYRDLSTSHLEIFMQSISAAGVPQWTIDGVNVGAGLGDEFSPAMIADGAGGAIAVWQDTRNGSVDLYAQRVNSSGARQWAATGLAISVAAANQLNQRVVPDGAGGAIVVWQDSRNGQSDIYAQRINGAGVVQWAANGVVVSAVPNDTKFSVQAISDGAGGVIAVWSDTRNGANQDVYAQRLNGSGVAQWTAGGVPVTSASGPQGNPQIATDGAGGVIAVWSDYRSGTSTFDQDLYAQRLNSAGVPQWTANGAPVTQAASAQQNHSVCSDGAGGVFVAWEDEREVTPFYVWAQHVDATGAQVWAHDGGKLCTQPSSAPVIAPDGAGGAIVVWQDLRAGDALTRLYAQRYSSGGVAQWPVFDGVAVGTSAGNHNQQSILPVGTGGAIVVWHDDHDQTSYITNNDVFAQNLNPDGTLGPPTTAVAPAAAPASFALGRVEPNPSRGDLRVPLALPGGTPATLELFDLAGRRVAAREIAGSPGAQAVALSAGNAAPGVYSLVLRQGDRLASRRVVIAR